LAIQASAVEGRRELVSVVMVNLNCLQYVDAVLESLKIQTYRPIELLIFDNGSSDGSLERIRERAPDASVFEMGRNTGFSRPNNEGIRHAKGAYVLCLNFDVVLEKDFIEEMVAAIERSPEIGWAAGKMLKLVGRERRDEIDCLGHHMSKCRYATETDHSRPFSWEQYSVPQYVFGASACAALYRRAMLEDIALGGEYFDEDFFAYFEDVDLDWRAQQRNWKCLYTPKAVGYHARGGSQLIRNWRVAGCYLSNHLFLQIKNDHWPHLREDLRPISRKALSNLAGYLRKNPLAVAAALGRIVRHLPRMYRKRRIIASRRTASLGYLRGLIR